MTKEEMRHRLKDNMRTKKQPLKPIDSGKITGNVQISETVTKDALSRFERRQVILGTIQTVILAIGTSAAVYLGVTQTAINQKLYDLNFTVATEIIYDANEKKLYIFNKGRENIWLWGSKLGSNPKFIDQERRLIAPGSSYYVLAANMEKEVLEKVGTRGELRVPFDVYLKDGRHRPYIARVILFIQVAEGKLTVHTQTVAIDQMQW
jgi:hypothetical protein